MSILPKTLEKRTKPLKRRGRKRGVYDADPVRASRSHYEARYYAAKRLRRASGEFDAVIFAIRKEKRPYDYILDMPELRANPEVRAWLANSLPRELPEHLQLNADARRVRSSRARYNELYKRAHDKLGHDGIRGLVDRRDLDEVGTFMAARLKRDEILAQYVVARNDRLAEWVLKNVPEEPMP